uniref:Caspase family p20 domain-containing protein n=1 Tax=Clastoptera arizonana TaxID=38151 RepID=A0A1B6EA82_9HEMI
MALLIGNNSYDHLGDLMCTNNDVLAISEVLRKLGFHIFAMMNLTLVEMINATKWFFKVVPQNAYVLFYFAGHGFEFGEKFMMPVDCPEKTYTRKDCFCDKELIQTALEASPCLLVMILDMCLQPPSEENKEIYAEKAIVYQYKPEEHDIITFTSTSSHQNAYERPRSKNGLLVQHLIKHLEEYNDVNTILRSTQEDFKRNHDSKYQKPTLISNTSTIYKLTDSVPEDEKLIKSIRSLTSLSVTLNLKFSRVNFSSSIHLSHHKSCFLNSIDLVFPSAFNRWIITADINTEVSFSSTDNIYMMINNVKKH